MLGENHFYCFFALVDGVDLVDYVAAQKRLTESVARVIFRQILSAIGNLLFRKADLSFEGQK